MQILFIILFSVIQYQGDNDGRPTFRYTFKGQVYDHVYKEEIINSIKTGEFKYNEDFN